LLRTLTNIPFSVHLLLLVLIPLLRWPGFHAHFFLPEESFFTLLGARISEGGGLYQDAWHAGPPLLAWLYAAFHWVFGEKALFAIRVFACFYLYLTAIYFNGILAGYKPFKRYQGLTAVLFVWLASVPWYLQEMSASLFVLLPVVVSFHAIVQVGDNRRQNYRLMFGAGIWMMVAILASYKATFLLLGVLLAYMVLHTARFDEMVAMAGGLLAVLGTVLVSLFFSRSLAAFWDVGVLYYVDRVNISGSEVYQYDLLLVLQQILASWGAVLFLGLVGFLHFRLRFFSYVAKIRSIELTMAVWLIGVLLMLGFKWRRLELGDFVLLVPPLVFYARKVFDFAWGYRLRAFWVLAITGFPLFLYLNFWGLTHPNSPAWMRPARDQEVRHGGMRYLLQRDSRLFAELQRKADAPPEVIWIMGWRPEWYLTLGQWPPTKYTDYRIAHYKLGSIPAREELRWSRTEPERLFFETFVQARPRYILDPKDNFPNLQQRYPSLFESYQARKLDGINVYERGARPGQ
jgi:hypothetical protein